MTKARTVADVPTNFPEGAWQSWAPTLSGGWANGNGVWTALYSQIGKTVHVYGAFVIGTTTTKGTGMTISLPVTGRGLVNSLFPIRLRSALLEYFGYGRIISTTTFEVATILVNSNYPSKQGITATVPNTWATGDGVYFSFTYEAA